MMTGFEKIFPRSSQKLNGKQTRFTWFNYPQTLGSYSCYLPGQWTSIGNAQFFPVGNLFFAGEHCSYDFQGYMNGGAETGRKAAEDLLALLNLK
jgi:monoamine oxidase